MKLFINSAEVDISQWRRGGSTLFATVKGGLITPPASGAAVNVEVTDDLGNVIRPAVPMTFASYNFAAVENNGVVSYTVNELVFTEAK